MERVVWSQGTTHRVYVQQLEGGHVLHEAKDESARVEEIGWSVAKEEFDAVTLKS